jgi:hypothetical protein
LNSKHKIENNNKLFIIAVFLVFHYMNQQLTPKYQLGYDEGLILCIGVVTNSPRSASRIDEYDARCLSPILIAATGPLFEHTSSGVEQEDTAQHRIHKRFACCCFRHIFYQIVHFKTQTQAKA